jgi:hypothetical protein
MPLNAQETLFPDTLNRHKEYIRAIDFTVKDIMHKITAKFTHAFLPDAKMSFYLRAVLQPELDVHGIASKADVYNVSTSPKIIEDTDLTSEEIEKL